MRGKAFHTKNSLLLIRITPAYAGKRDFPTVPFLFLWDHPRLCGEKLPRTVQNEPMQGSPPPMRGKGTAGSGGLKNERITPAYAGKRKTRSFLSDTVRDHPRLCGEKSVLIICTLPYQGSPPPMRGKAKLNLFHPCYCGITPAYAGKSFTVSAISASVKDHPRLCGEKFDCRCPLDSRQGSPPPMRGKGRAKNRSASAQKDHPRLCGEKLSGGSTSSFVKGSPPPMRGKDVIKLYFRRFPGITPAYAGKRSGNHVDQVGNRDHPRLCGEK